MPPKTNFLTGLDAVETFEDLEALLGDEALDIVKAALRQRETSRVAHKMYYLRRQKILAIATERGITA